MDSTSEHLSSIVKRISLKEIMSVPPIILHIDDPFHMVEKTLRENSIKHLPIINDSKKLVGIITLSDLYRTCAPRRKPEDGSFFYPEEQLDQYSLSVIMTKNPKALKFKNTLYDALKLMSDFGCGCVPVVDDQGRIVGIITQTDIVKRITAIFKD